MSIRFQDFKFIVLCDGLFDAGYIDKADALRHIAIMKKTYPSRTYTIFNVEVDGADDEGQRELDRIWYSYQQQLEEEWDR